MDSKKTGVFMLDEKYLFAEENPPLLIVGNTVELICDGPAIVKEVIVNIFCITWKKLLLSFFWCFCWVLWIYVELKSFNNWR